MLLAEVLITAASWRLPKAAIALEIDLPDRGLLAFGDGEDQIDPLVSAFDDLRHHADVVAPGMPVGLHDAADIGLHRGALQRPARLGLDHAGKILVLDLLVAFEGDAVEKAGLGEMHHQPVAGAVDRHLVEQPGREQRLEPGIARGVVETPVGKGVEIAAHRLGIDAPVADDIDPLAARRSRSQAPRRRGVRPRPTMRPPQRSGAIARKISS